uniref:Uncharacterized protein n=1 Tax=Steinernema glaseri TaxID=37863 RepID=A0A1I7Z061_9BILA
MNPKLAKPIVSHCRLLLNMLSTVFFFSMVIFGPILGQQPNDFIADKDGKLYKWTPESPRYLEHMIGTTSEWLLAICFQLYILSFAIELRHAYCHAPKLRLVAFYDGESDITSSSTVPPAAVPYAVPGIGSNHMLYTVTDRPSALQEEELVVKVKF